MSAQSASKSCERRELNPHAPSGTPDPKSGRGVTAPSYKESVATQTLFRTNPHGSAQNRAGDVQNPVTRAVSDAPPVPPRRRCNKQRYQGGWFVWCPNRALDGSDYCRACRAAMAKRAGAEGRP